MSDDAIHYAFSRCISRPGEKLQRDRLIDARVFVKILNLDEIRAVVNRNGRPCASMTLLLASLLWPHPRLFPLDFDLSVMTPAPPTFYALDFDTRRLPPPPGDSYGFNVLFALQVESDEMLAVQLADFCFAIVAHIQTVSTGIELWDLTFRVDRNRVLGTLQFETRSGHEKTQADAYFCTNSLFTSNPITEHVVFYRELSGLHLDDPTVYAYVAQINLCLEDLTENGQRYKCKSCHVTL